MGRAIAAWHRGAARTADLADLRSAVRNILRARGRGRSWMASSRWEVVTMSDESV
jgi:hypothetical protein